MIQKEIIEILNNKVFPNGIAEVRCNILDGKGICRENQSILVIVDKGTAECFDDQVTNSLHWFVCDSVQDFISRISMDSEKSSFDSIAIKNVLNVKPFVSDFEPKDRNGSKVKVGDKVRWYDPDESSRDLDRIYTISRIDGYHLDDIILIGDESSEAEVFASEIEIVSET